MPKGGPRSGAGRPKGSPNKATAAKAAEVAASGLTPLDYMLQRLRDEQLADTDRFEAAKAAAPYVHPRLNSVEGNMRTVLALEEAIDAITAGDAQPT